jgi:pimeloyl-ACP methyl ester carboxylesterase
MPLQALCHRPSQQMGCTMRGKHSAAARRDQAVVVFLHSNGSPRQWQPYMERFALRYRAVAPPLIGYELGSDWRPGSPGNPEKTVSAEREAALLEPWLYLAPEGAHLVGHSYGAAVVLHAALRYPGRVRSVVAYEPVLFNLLAAEPRAQRQLASIGALRAAVKRYCASGDFTGSARVFVDYWSGHGAWDRLPPDRQQAIAVRMPKVDAEFDGMLSEATRLDDYRQVRAPVLCLYGSETRSAARQVARLLWTVLARVDLMELPGMGHLGPITHAAEVGGLVQRHIDAHAPADRRRSVGRARSFRRSAWVTSGGCSARWRCARLDAPLGRDIKHLPTLGGGEAPGPHPTLSRTRERGLCVCSPGGNRALSAAVPEWGMAALQVDLLVVGGGIHGAGIARDAAGRGVRVAMVEKGDLAGATSSASSKLAHGGLRYLEQFDLRLVREALQERETLMRIAPHLVQPLPFFLPSCGQARPAWQVRAGLLLYDLLAGRSALPRSHRLDLAGPEGEILQPQCRRGLGYWDGWADDARLVVANAMDAARRGTVVLTRTRCTRPAVRELAAERGPRRIRARCCARCGQPPALGGRFLGEHPISPRANAAGQGSHVIILPPAAGRNLCCQFRWRRRMVFGSRAHFARSAPPTCM